jgi:hypothetical protein
MPDNQPCDLVSQGFPRMVPFRTRFLPCEMARTAYVQRLIGCLYTLWYCYIPTCRFHGTACPCTNPQRSCASTKCGRLCGSASSAHHAPGPPAPVCGSEAMPVPGGHRMRRVTQPVCLGISWLKVTFGMGNAAVRVHAQQEIPRSCT